MGNTLPSIGGKKLVSLGTTKIGVLDGMASTHVILYRLISMKLRSLDPTLWEILFLLISV